MVFIVAPATKSPPEWIFPEVKIRSLRSCSVLVRLGWIHKALQSIQPSNARLINRIINKGCSIYSCMYVRCIARGTQTKHIIHVSRKCFWKIQLRGLHELHLCSSPLREICVGHLWTQLLICYIYKSYIFQFVSRFKFFFSIYIPKILSSVNTLVAWEVGLCGGGEAAEAKILNKYMYMPLHISRLFCTFTNLVTHSLDTYSLLFVCTKQQELHVHFNR